MTKTLAALSAEPAKLRMLVAETDETGPAADKKYFEETIESGRDAKPDGSQPMPGDLAAGIIDGLDKFAKILKPMNPSASVLVLRDSLKNFPDSDAFLEKIKRRYEFDARFAGRRETAIRAASILNSLPERPRRCATAEIFDSEVVFSLHGRSHYFITFPRGSENFLADATRLLGPGKPDWVRISRSYAGTLGLFLGESLPWGVLGQIELNPAVPRLFETNLEQIPYFEFAAASPTLDRVAKHLYAKKGKTPPPETPPGSAPGNRGETRLDLADLLLLFDETKDMDDGEKATLLDLDPEAAKTVVSLLLILTTTMKLLDKFTVAVAVPDPISAVFGEVFPDAAL
ncbi:MAG: hypothetical protein LBF41_02040 [Deltaproteobacteria bacterium]|jgi:hypothetical protein|nr:hypothetical protein [Deltaproteobacteria bacterium]